jgi:tol-pal system protein YbgF
MKITTESITVCLLLVAILFGCATRQDMNAVDSRLMEMELRDAEARKNRDDIKYQVEEYSKMRASMDQELRRQSASLRALIEELREEIRILNGRLEEYDFALKQQKKGVDAFQSKTEALSNQLLENTAKNDQRIASLENYLKMESARKPAKVAPVVKPSYQEKAPDKLSEEQIYKLGKQAFDQGDSDTAKKHFQELMKRYPKSENADNAQFWIGEIYYREKWYEKAILEYQNVIEKFPKGNKVPAALLKQGLAFQNIGDKSNSRLILEELIKKYPKTNEAKIARENIKEQ